MERPIQTIVTGVDFTPCSRVALRQALRIAAQHGARTNVVHIIDTAVALELEEALSPLQQNIHDALVGNAHRAWTLFAKGIPEADKLRLDVRVEHRIVGLLGYARTVKSDLLVLGAFGTRPPDVGIGTVATACVRRSNCDVLLVRDTQTEPFQRILAAVDFSDTSALALRRAAQFAARDHAKLHVVHVFDPPWEGLYQDGVSSLDLPRLTDQYKGTLKRRLDDFAEATLKDIRHARVDCTLFESRSHRNGIMEYADQVKAQLVCLGTRGRSNMRDILLGSTAEKALMNSRCSVLAVHPDDKRGA